MSTSHTCIYGELTVCCVLFVFAFSNAAKNCVESNTIYTKGIMLENKRALFTRFAMQCHGLNNVWACSHECVDAVFRLIFYYCVACVMNTINYGH